MKTITKTELFLMLEKALEAFLHLISTKKEKVFITNRKAQENEKKNRQRRQKRNARSKNDA